MFVFTSASTLGYAAVSESIYVYKSIIASVSAPGTEFALILHIQCSFRFHVYICILLVDFWASI